MRKHYLHTLSVTLILGLGPLLVLLGLMVSSEVSAQGPTVQIFLFYSETCPHCHVVREKILPPLQDKYGRQLEVQELEITDKKNYEFLLQLEEAYEIPPEIVGVPEIFIGSDYLIGSVEIEEKLDGLIAKYLAQGGVDYPAPKGAADAAPADPESAASSPDVPSDADSPVAFYVFWDSKCGPCLKLMNEVLPEVLGRYDSGRISVHDYDLERGGYPLMRSLETKYGLEVGTMPEVFIGTEALLGLEEIERRLPTLIEQYLASGGVALPDPSSGEEKPSAPTAGSSHTGAVDSPELHIAYFYQVGCQECDRAELDLRYLRDRYPQVQITSFDSREHAALLEQLGARAGVPEARRLLAPAVFIGSDALVLDEVRASRLESLAAKYLETGAPAFWVDDAGGREQAAGKILERFRSFGPLTVAVAGLIDGLNPCAFATVVFFISYLAFVGRRGREILLVGFAFTLGVFLTYLGVGLGFLKAVAALPFFAEAAPWVYGFTAALCLILALLSFHDFWQMRRGQAAEMRLKLPTVLRKRINWLIREGAGLQAFVPVALVTGALISLIELACTGQIYLPVIMFVLGVPEMRASAVSYLLLYNAMFIVPLVIVFLAAYWGTTSERMGMLISRQASTVKLATAVLFLLMGGWLALTVLG